MNKIFVAILFTSLMSLFGCSPNKPSHAAKALFAEKGIDSTQTSLILNTFNYFPVKTQISIALISDTATIFLGLNRMQDTTLSVVNSAAHFEIGSISNLFTSALLADFVESGKVQLSDSISKYIPFTVKDSIEITLEQLANHTSGLPQVPTGMVINSLLNMDNPYKNFNEKALVAYMQNDVVLAQKPGEKYAFSNLGMGLLAYTLSQIDSVPLGTLLKEHIFDKYNMANSTIYRDSIRNTLVGGLDAKGAPATNWDMAAMAGAGGVLSTSIDLASFAKAHCDSSDSVLALTRKATFNINNGQEICLGWTVEANEDGERWYSQNGATGGYTSCIVINPKTCRAVVVLSNVSKSNSYSESIKSLTYGLMRTFE